MSENNSLPFGDLFPNDMERRTVETGLVLKYFVFEFRDDEFIRSGIKRSIISQIKTRCKSDVCFNFRHDQVPMFVRLCGVDCAKDSETP